MFDLADVRIFVQAVDAGGLSAAARVRSMPKSSISRALVRLEARLGVVLLERSTRGMRVSDAGLLFLPHARRLLDSAEEAQAAVDGLIDQPQGILKVNAALTFALGVIAPMLPSFLDCYPDVSVVLDTDNHIIDLARGDADLAIRIGALADSDLMVRRLGDIELWPCASPAYLALHGTPVSVPDLDRHRLIDRRGVGAAWQSVLLQVRKNTVTSHRELPCRNQQCSRRFCWVVPVSVDYLISWPGRTYSQAAWCGCFPRGAANASKPTHYTPGIALSPPRSGCSSMRCRITCGPRPAISPLIGVPTSGTACFDKRGLRMRWAARTMRATKETP